MFNICTESFVQILFFSFLDASSLLELDETPSDFNDSSIFVMRSDINLLFDSIKFAIENWGGALIYTAN